MMGMGVAGWILWFVILVDLIIFGMFLLSHVKK